MTDSTTMNNEFFYKNAFLGIVHFKKRKNTQSQQILDKILIFWRKTEV